MNDEQKRIWDYLSKNAVGIKNRKSSNEIRDTLKLRKGGPTNDHVRHLISDMVNNHECLIGSLTYEKGYWIIENTEELNKVIEHLNSRANSVRERGITLQKNWDSKK